MKIGFALKLLLPLGVVLFFAQPALACHKGTPHGSQTSCDGGGSSGGGSSGGTFPATTFDGWLCEIDLLPTSSYQAGSDTSQYTTDTHKLCTGSNPDGNVHITCEKVLPGTVFNGTPFSGAVSCDVNRAQCDELCGTAGHTACVVNVTGQLSIDTAGLATLQCSYN